MEPLVPVPEVPQRTPVVSPLLQKESLLTPPNFTTAEVSLILRRRLENLSLPETPHLLFSERLCGALNAICALLFKWHLLQTAQVQKFRESRRKEFSGLRIVSILHLTPLRLLLRPLLLYVPVLHWLLTPFRAMSGAFLMDALVRAARSRVQRRLPPVPQVPVAADFSALREYVQEGLQASKASIGQFMEDRRADFEKLKIELEEKFRNEADLKLPPAIRPETPGVPSVSFRTPVRGRGFRTPVGTRAFRGTQSPRRGLVGISEAEAIGDVGSPGLALLPRSIARGVETPRDGASPPASSPAEGSLPDGILRITEP